MSTSGYPQNNLFQPLHTEARPLIVLVGNTLLIDSVEASLTKMRELDVMRVQTDLSNINKYLTSLAPDLIIFDWDCLQSRFALPFLRQQPGIPLVGLDSNTSQTIILTSQHYPIASADELGQVIQLQTGHKFCQGSSELVLLNREVLKQYFKKKVLPVT